MAAFDAVGLLSVLDAALAAELEVSFFGAFRWESALPAADLAALLLLGDARVLAALLATLFEVTSFFAMYMSFRKKRPNAKAQRREVARPLERLVID